ncbi:hypothetical protein [uncultured Paraglaciecola sp.]|uniref:hypothetical protein n=1 Tax=uncultured Paraglaciecola sp. TaxID=1765024 RepID=UPI0026308B1F|nr:hypothetical protein [uncultured Paraglaciecola sp.]
MSTDKQRAGLGFEDELDSIDFESWTPDKSDNHRSNIDPETVRKVAEKEGFTSREQLPQKPPADNGNPTVKAKKEKPKKEPTDQINFRAKVSTIEAFKAICDSQEPKWPHGYALERALKALKRELEG